MTQRQPERRKNLKLRDQLDGYERDAREAARRATSTADEASRQNLLDIAESLAALVIRMKERARKART